MTKYQYVITPETFILPEAHAISKGITQATQNNKPISRSIKRFFTSFYISSTLKASNAYKKWHSGNSNPSVSFPADLSNRKMYMNLITIRNTPKFAKDAVYRFMKIIQINQSRFTSIFQSESSGMPFFFWVLRIVQKSLNSLPKSMTMQSTKASLNFEYLPHVLVRWKHVPVGQQYSSFRRKQKTVSMKQKKRKKELLVTDAKSLP